MRRILPALGLALALSHAGTQVRVNGALYPRYVVEPGFNTFVLMGAEATVLGQVTGETRDIVTAAIQLTAGHAMHGWTGGFHFGEAYALVPLGLGLPTVRIGQAVIPFGLLAGYDTHSQIVQTPYARTIGLRLDPGIGLLGTLGPTGYWLWVSNGNGPYVADSDAGKVITTRIAPTFLLGDAEVTVGLSGLAGSLPHWELDDLEMQMTGPHEYAAKYRLGLDNTADWGPFTLRLEGVGGKDEVRMTKSEFGIRHSTFDVRRFWVYGYYAEARYAFSSRLEGLAKYDGWHVRTQGAARNAAVGIAFLPFNASNLNLQAVGQVDWLDTETKHKRSPSLALQAAVRI